MKTLPLHHELRDARDGFADPARFILRERAGAEATSEPSRQNTHATVTPLASRTTKRSEVSWVSTHGGGKRRLDMMRTE
jgi:hypothetical protein